MASNPVDNLEAVASCLRALVDVVRALGEHVNADIRSTRPESATPDDPLATLTSLVTFKQASASTGLPVKTLRMMARRGQMKTVKVGTRGLRLTKASLLALTREKK
jgi:hypothetical protein